MVRGQPLYLSCELNKERDVVWRKDGKIVVEKPGKIVPGVIGLLRALTINDADDMRFLIERNVDAIMTDDPQLMKQVLEEYKK